MQINQSNWEEWNQITIVNPQKEYMCMHISPLQIEIFHIPTFVLNTINKVCKFSNNFYDVNIIILYLINS